jgi:hypothetical protein
MRPEAATNAHTPASSSSTGVRGATKTAPNHQSIRKTLAPLSVAEATTFGVKTSMNPARSSALRKPDDARWRVLVTAPDLGARCSEVSSWS